MRADVSRWVVVVASLFGACAIAACDSPCCVDDAACADGAVCFEGVCALVCVDDAGCAEGERCRGGACVDAALPGDHCPFLADNAAVR